MATIKVKFRASSVEMKEGSLYYQVIHNRLARQVHTGYKLFPSEWDAGISEIVMDSGTEGGRRNYLLSVKTALADDLSRFRSIIARLERSDVMYTADKVVELFSSPADCGGFVSFARQLIKELKQIGKRRTAETYTTVLNSFLRFRGERDLLFGEVDSNLMVEYETFLKGCDVCPNSSSFYMRNLRAIYNRAVERELTVQRYPFRHVYTGVDKTVRSAESDPPDTGSGPDTQSHAGLRERPVPFLFLYKGNVICGYGLPEKERFTEWSSGLPSPEDGTTALYQVGEAHAGDHRQVRHVRDSLSVADHTGHERGCPKTIQERGASGKSEFEENR